MAFWFLFLSSSSYQFKHNRLSSKRRRGRVLYIESPKLIPSLRNISLSSRVFGLWILRAGANFIEHVLIPSHIAIFSGIAAVGNSRHASGSGGAYYYSQAPPQVHTSTRSLNHPPSTNSVQSPHPIHHTSSAASSPAQPTTTHTYRTVTTTKLDPPHRSGTLPSSKRAPSGSLPPPDMDPPSWVFWTCRFLFGSTVLKCYLDITLNTWPLLPWGINLDYRPR